MNNIVHGLEVRPLADFTGIDPDVVIMVVNAYKERGYEIEPVIFDNNVNVIRALNDGALDASLGVHKPFMEKFNADNEGGLVMVDWPGEWRSSAYVGKILDSEDTMQCYGATS